MKTYKKTPYRKQTGIQEPCNATTNLVEIVTAINNILLNH